MTQKSKDQQTRQSRIDQGHRNRATGGAGESSVATLFHRWGWHPVQIGAANDQGSDFIVEFCENGLGTGFHFFVSAKATTSSTPVKRSFVAENLRKNAVEYLLRQRMPVFLMKARLADGCIYWIDLKQAIRANGRSKGGGFRAHLPLAHRLSIMGEDTLLFSERDAFQKELEKSDADWRPPQVRAAQAVRDRKEELDALDARCTVSVTVSDRMERIDIHALTPLALHTKVVPANEAEATKLKESLYFGTRNDIAVDRFHLEGSPLLERLMPHGAQGILQIGNHPADTRVVLLSAPGISGNDEGSLRFKGPITRGHGGAEIKADSEDSPLSLRLRNDEKKSQQSFTLNIGVASWAGKFLDGMHGLVRSAATLIRIADKEAMRITSIQETGPATVTVPFAGDGGQGLQDCADLLLRLDDLRHVARLYGKNVVLGPPDAWNDEQIADWTVARQLLDGKIVRRAVNIEIGFALDPGEDAAALTGPEAKCFVVEQIGFIVQAFHQEVCRFLVDMLIVDYSVHVDASGWVDLRSKPDSRLYIRRSSSIPFAMPQETEAFDPLAPTQTVSFADGKIKGE